MMMDTDIFSNRKYGDEDYNILPIAIPTYIVPKKPLYIIIKKKALFVIYRVEKS
jgi:hypothetical protein